MKAYDAMRFQQMDSKSGFCNLTQDKYSRELDRDMFRPIYMHVHPYATSIVSCQGTKNDCTHTHALSLTPSYTHTLTHT